MIAPRVVHACKHNNGCHTDLQQRHPSHAMSPKFQLFGTVHSKGTGSEPVRITRDNELHVEPTFALYKSLAVATSRQDEQHMLDEAESKKHRTIGVWHDWLLELEGERPRWSPHIVIDVSDLSDSEIDAVKSIAAGMSQKDRPSQSGSSTSLNSPAAGATKTQAPLQSERSASLIAPVKAWVSRQKSAAQDRYEWLKPQTKIEWDLAPTKSRYGPLIRHSKQSWESALAEHHINDVRVTLESMRKVHEAFDSAGYLPTPGTLSAEFATHLDRDMISDPSRCKAFCSDFVVEGTERSVASVLVSSGYDREQLSTKAGRITMAQDWLTGAVIEELVSEINAESQ